MEGNEGQGGRVIPFTQGTDILWHDGQGISGVVLSPIRLLPIS
jgi:hypothetical protein